MARSLRTSRYLPRVNDERVRPPPLGAGTTGRRKRLRRGYQEVRSATVWRVLEDLEQWRALSKEWRRDYFELRAQAVNGLRALREKLDKHLV